MLNARLEEENHSNLATTNATSPFEFRQIVSSVKSPGTNDRDLKAFLNKAGVSKRDLEDPVKKDFIYSFIELHGGMSAVKEEMSRDSEEASCIENDTIIDPELKAFFDKAGISESDLEDPAKRDFIFDFIELHGGIYAVRKEMNSNRRNILFGILNAWRKKESVFKLIKNNIGSPFDFRHVASCRILPRPSITDPDLRAFLQKAGVTDSDLEDPEKRDFIYNFIEQHGGIEAIKLEMNNDLNKD